MAYWLMKTEPHDYGWPDLVRDGRVVWDGVRNHAAAGHMRAMRKDDRVFFYRSQENPAVVGIMKVVREAWQDPDDPKGSYALVELAPVAPVAAEVTLKAIKAEPALQHLALVRQSRLSVSPVDDEAWARICAMAGVPATL
jgi:predicted RNA-binding protein with PUA-like domain